MSNEQIEQMRNETKIRYEVFEIVSMNSIAGEITYVRKLDEVEFGTEIQAEIHAMKFKKNHPKSNPLTIIKTYR